MNTKEVPASATLMELIGVRLSQLIERGAKEANLPAGSNLDIGRGVWVVPVPDAPKDPAP